MPTDKERLDFLEEQAKNSYSGVTLQKIPTVENVKGGFRFMRRFYISKNFNTLRDAIDQALKDKITFKQER